MAGMITDIGDYFTRGCGRCARFDTPDCSARKWAEGLAALRRICLATGLEEVLRWGHPCYRHAGRNIAILGAFRGDFRLNFFNGGLLGDPSGILEKQGADSQQESCIRFTANDAVKPLEPVIAAYLREAMGHAETGVKPERTPGQTPLPQELVDALDADPELAEAFGRLTPGRQRSYAINLNAAKSPATRLSRIAKFRDRILAGKGATER